MALSDTVARGPDALRAPAKAVKLRLDGMALHGRWWGAGAPKPPVAGRPALVFLHDGLGSCAAWEDFPGRVADLTGLEAFAYDRPGHGNSAPRAAFPPGLVMEEAARLPKVLSAAGIGEHILIGHSDGATLALLHAARNPAGLRAVVSLAAHVHGDEAARRHVARHRRLAAAGRIPGWLTRLHGAKAAALSAGWSAVWQQAFGEGWDIGRQLGAIRVPLLALQGAADPSGLPGQLAAIAETVPGAETHLLPGVGHFPHRHDPQGMAARIAVFVAQIDPDA